MTGVTSGLGKVSAVKAASQGATVIAMARDPEKAKKLVSTLKNSFPDTKGSIETVLADLSSLPSIVKACETIASNYPRIDRIVNNAGIMNFKHVTSNDGIEETWQINVLAPMLISHLLYEPLKRSAEPRLIFTSSGLHQGTINFSNIEFNGDFTSFKVYRQSKLAVILLCRLLAPLLEKDHIGIYSWHPGVVKTGLGRNADGLSKLIFWLMGKSPVKGAETLNYLLETSKSNLINGEYYTGKKVKQTTPQSYDLEMAVKLHNVVRTYLTEYIKTTTEIFNS